MTGRWPTPAGSRWLRTALVLVAAGCGGPQKLGDTGATCFRDDDCSAGLICVAPTADDIHRVCSNDPTPLISMVMGPDYGGMAMGGGAGAGAGSGGVATAGAAGTAAGGTASGGVAGGTASGGSAGKASTGGKGGSAGSGGMALGGTDTGGSGGTGGAGTGGSGGTDATAGAP